MVHIWTFLYTLFFCLSWMVRRIDVKWWWWWLLLGFCCWDPNNLLSGHGRTQKLTTRMLLISEIDR
jgi:hypothetical protein